MNKVICTFVFICVLAVIFGIVTSAQDNIICKKSAVCININQEEINRVNALVKTGYKGNYTLEWARQHDYKESEKVKWVNIKRYSSKTDYLVWVSIAYQRLNIFSGSAGNWNLQQTFIISTGAPGRDTPVGVWSLISKSPKGWTTSVYTVKPVINFINEKYGFHSRLYYHDSAKIYDERIGFPCSHGCIRLYSDDLAWFYKSIPLGTTVVVF
jgi:lipoprotein-anchoring transpeptidase ErfK/SrfK